MITNNTIVIQTKGHCDMIDITPQLIQMITDSKFKIGTLTAFVSGPTAAITVFELEPNLVADFKELREKIAPENEPYHHDETWDDGNGYAHVRASLLGPSLVVPFMDGKLALGAWQQIALVDFDNRSRERNVAV